MKGIHKGWTKAQKRCYEVYGCDPVKNWKITEDLARREKAAKGFGKGIKVEGYALDQSSWKRPVKV